MSATHGGVPTLLDHIVVAGPSLAGLIDWFESRTGVVAAAGGKHPTGTANALVALTADGARGRHYIELLGPDPDATVPPTTFGIDGLTAPTIVTYAVHPADVDAVIARARDNGFDPGDVAALSRRTPDGTLLQWRLTRPQRDGVPFLIDWADTAHPGLGALPTVEFVAFERVDADAVAVRAALAALGLPEGSLADVVDGTPSAFRLALRRADGTQITL